MLNMDARRMIPDYEELVGRGYGYIAVGSPYLAPVARQNGSHP